MGAVVSSMSPLFLGSLYPSLNRVLSFVTASSNFSGWRILCGSATKAKSK